MTKMDGRTPDIAEENIEKLKQLFPEICCEDKVDFDKLKQVLGDYVDDDTERYNFTWNGKGRALKLSQTPSTGTLRPCKEESKNWDDTENLYIEGDNLEVLKLLQKSYYGKVKMIYIDPPYNTGNDFVYKDSFKDGIDNYKGITGQIDSEGKNIGTNSETSGRYHTDWLNMMYPRLRLARNLLTDDGVIFVSIDDNEFDNMNKICDEVFGENNLAVIFTWTKTSTPPALSNKCRKTVEYVLCYEKSANNSRFYGSLLDNGDVPLLNTGNGIKILEFPASTVCFKKKKDGLITEGEYQKLNILNDVHLSNYFNTNSVKLEGEFKWTQETLNKEIEAGTKFIIKSEKMSIRFQRIEDENAFKTPNNFLDVQLNKENNVGTNESAVKELASIEMNDFFDYPKPISLMKKLLNMKGYKEKNAIVLDFFSGSATTADAVMQLNAEDGGNRNFIMVQIPEETDEKGEAYEAGYKNICEIGKERIRRAGERIKTEIEEENKQVKMGEEPKKEPDIGFKVLKLDSSNIKKWQPDDEKVEDTLLSSINNFMPDRTESDVVYEIMLKLGLNLTYPIEVKEAAGKKIYSIGMGSLMICLDDDITIEVAEIMIKLHNELHPEIWKVVFKDNGFKDDSAKINIFEIFKSAGLDEDAFTTI